MYKLNRLQKQNKYWLTFWLCAAAAACFLVPCWVLDKGIFLYAGDFNSQQITFYTYTNQFVKAGGGSFSWLTDLGSSFINSYSFYMLGSPFWWLTLLLPPMLVPYAMVPMLLLKFGVAGGGAYLWARRYVRDRNMAVVVGLLYTLSGFSVYNIFFNHFIDVVALFPYMLWALDETLHEGRRGIFPIFVALNLLNNYFFFFGQALFLFIYFFCKLSAGEFKCTPKLFFTLAFESLLGCGLGGVLVWPALLSLLNNPRTVDLSSGYGFLLYGNSQQYGAILSNLFLPPDIPFVASICPDGTVKWTSMTAWLPLTGASAAVAWCRSKGGAAKRILYVCAVCAMVPVLNSAFYMLNSSYYARWYYMPVLVMALATVMALEHSDVDVFRLGIRPVFFFTLAFAAFALIPVKDKETEQWSIGVADPQPWFWIRIVIAVLGLCLFARLCKQPRNKEFPRKLLAMVMAVGIVNGLVHIEFAKFDQWAVERDYVQQLKHDAREMEWPEDGFWRIDAYGCHDNIGVWAGKSCLQFFNSTVAPSVMEFYPTVGVKRDVSSKPDVAKYELRSLLSVKYTLVQSEQEEEFLEKTEKGNWLKVGQQGDLLLYENQYYLPMGFCLPYYMTLEDYKGMSESMRQAALLKAIVLDEEQVEKYGDLLQELPEGRRSGRQFSAFTKSLEMIENTCSDFKADSRGFSAACNLEQPNLMFFSVPYDKGFEATVNGQPAEVLKVDQGFCAVYCPEGKSEIRFDYHTPGLKISILLALGSVFVYAAYGVWLWKRRKNAANTK